MVHHKLKEFFVEKYNIETYTNEISFEEIIHKYCNRKQNSSNLKDLDAFNILNLCEVSKMLTIWNKYLPRIRPFYAIKNNPDPMILETIIFHGGGFSCVSQQEIKLISEIKNVKTSNDIFFSNPVKHPFHLKYAQEVGVQFTTADNLYELDKIKMNFGNGKVLIHIAVDDSKSICQNSTKYGIELEDLEEFFEKSQDLEINLVGVSFSVGSRCFDVTSYIEAIEDAKTVFDMAKKFDYNFNILNIGGTFYS
jgi:ornithine decarboxylase